MKFPLPGEDLVGLIVAVSFAAGLNVYATVATLGLLAHAGVLVLPDSLQLLQNGWVIGASAAMFGIEFFADKLPLFDLAWNALHTFIRVPVASFLAWQTASKLSPGEQLGAAFLGGLIALAAHGGKTAVRAVVTPSPEPVSNISLSFCEDVAAVGLTWLATSHPLVAGSIAIVLVAIIVMLARLVYRALRSLFRHAEQALQSWTTGSLTQPPQG